MVVDTVKREINLYTPNKIYTGRIDIKSERIRTIDLLNSSNLYWKDPAQKSFEDAIMLSDVKVNIQGGKNLASFSKLQLRLSDIIFFSDSLYRTGNSTEKMRARTLSQKTNERVSNARILTRMRGDTFYLIVGVFHGLFKSKSKQRYFPLTEPKVHEILRTGSKWESNLIDIGNNFIGLSTHHIEACSFSEYDEY
jgi:hypothetical protein